MAWTSGTATDYVDLMNRMVAFLTTNTELVAANQNWVELSNNNEGFVRQYFLRGPGLSSSEQIFLQFRAFEDPANDRFNWQVNGALGYDALSPYEGQPNLSPDTYAYYWDQAIPYWFIANGQRIIVVARISTSYIVSYYGKLLPYGTPNAFPYRVVIGGCGGNPNARWSDSSDTFDVSCIMSPGTGCQFYTGDGGWRAIKNRSSRNGTSSTSDINVSPTHAGAFFRGTSSSWTTFSQVQPNPDGSYTRMPFILGTTKASPSVNMFGELDGLLWVTGTGNAAENIITDNGQDYLVVQNMNRTAWEEYAAVRLS